MHEFMPLNDGTEITHSDVQNDNSVLVHFEKPDVYKGFRYMTISLPSYEICENECFSASSVRYLVDYVRPLAHVIIECAMQGGAF